MAHAAIVECDEAAKATADDKKKGARAGCSLVQTADIRVKSARVGALRWLAAAIVGSTRSFIAPPPPPVAVVAVAVAAAAAAAAVGASSRAPRVVAQSDFRMRAHVKTRFSFRSHARARE